MLKLARLCLHTIDRRASNLIKGSLLKRSMPVSSYEALIHDGVEMREKLHSAKTSDWESLSLEEAFANLDVMVEPPSVEICICIILKCKKNRRIAVGQRVHTYLHQNGLEGVSELGNYLVSMHVQCLSMAKAQQVFMRLDRRSEHSWTALIQGYVEFGEAQRTLRLYEKMQEDHVNPTTHTFQAVVRACTKLKWTEKGREIHDKALKQSIENNVFVSSALVDMYAKCGSLIDAQCLLSKLPVKNTVIWTALISGYTEQGFGEEALKCLKQMRQEGVRPDAVTFACGLTAAGILGSVHKGQELHTEIVKEGVEKNTPASNALVDMYGKCGLLQEALGVFNKLSSHSVISWSCLIAGYSHEGESDVVFSLFERMRDVGMQPDDVTFLSLLSVCTHAGLIDNGLAIFEAMIKEYGVNPSIKHLNCMVDLFIRAGQFEEALFVMDLMPFQPNLVTWSTVLSACRKWGDIEVARWAFERAMLMEAKETGAFVLMRNICAGADLWKEM